MMAEYRIDRLGHHGDGITQSGLFAAKVLPGEVVTGTQDDKHLNDIRIITPSENRVSPPCRHFKSCGGCQLQHAADAFLADWKVDVVRRALDAVGLVADFLPIKTSPPASRRRATFAARRTKKGALAGFHAKGSDVIVDIPDCTLLHPDLMLGLGVARDLAILGASRKDTLAVSVTVSRSGLDVSANGGRDTDRGLETQLGELAGQHDLARLAWNGEVIAMRAPPYQVMGTVHVVPPPGSFLQATPQGQAALVARVLDIVGDADRVIDLFSGCGTFSLPLAARASVHAVEGDAAMLKALDAGWRHAQGLKQVSYETRDLFRRPVLADEFKGFGAAVIDPPRAGASAQVTEIVKSGVPTIAFVSCNPVSFAKDARDLVAAGYNLGPVQVVDQFRWSSHVELVAGFTLNLA